MRRWFATGALLALIACPALSAAADPPASARPARPAAPRKPAASSSAGEARLELSWNAPHGRPGALQALQAQCDSTRVDTLYLSIVPGRTDPSFLGFNATLYFRAAVGETLPAHWRFESVAADPRLPVRVVFGDDAERGFTGPWKVPGVGQGYYDHSSGSGRLRIIYAVAYSSAGPVQANRTYGVARVLVRRPAEGAEGCARPICVEWQASELAFAPGGGVTVKRGHRFASLNSPGGEICEPFRDPLAPRVWSPAPGGR